MSQCTIEQPRSLTAAAQESRRLSCSFSPAAHVSLNPTWESEIASGQTSDQNRQESVGWGPGSLCRASKKRQKEKDSLQHFDVSLVFSGFCLRISHLFPVWMDEGSSRTSGRIPAGWQELICFSLSQRHAERKKPRRKTFGGARRLVYMFTLWHLLGKTGSY